MQTRFDFSYRQGSSTTFVNWISCRVNLLDGFWAQLDFILAALKDKVCSLDLNSAGIFGLGIFLLLPPKGQNLGGISDDSNHVRPYIKFRGRRGGRERPLFFDLRWLNI